MNPIRTRPGSSSAMTLGILLVAVGIGWLALRQAGIDVATAIGSGGWPFFIIVPGLALLAAAVVPAPPRGIGLAIAGAVVATVGLVLFYQESTGHWERWAYMWALIPGAVGIAMTVYGGASRNRELCVQGLRTTVVAAVLFVGGLWFFESTFDTGQPPIDLGTWWPVLVIGIGALITVLALIGGPRSDMPRERSATTGDLT